MTEYSWPDQGTYDPDRLRAAWPATVRVLPVGVRVTGEVIARQPFGVFIRIGDVPDALGLAEITVMPRDVALPAIGTTVTGEVIWHAERNHQVKLRLLGAPAGTAASLACTTADEAPAAAARLVHVGHPFINFANRTYQWFDVQRFQLSEAVSDDRALLAALIAHERLGNDYATRPGDNPERHGPYWRDRITPACYDLIDTDAAERRVRAWASRFAPVPEDLRPELEHDVYQPLRAADRVYKLRDLGPAAFHEWGGVHNEFHELVIVDRTNRTPTLLVAADD